MAVYSIPPLPFLNFAYEFSPVTEGWSLANFFHLKWDSPMIINPDITSLLTFSVNRNSVQKILKQLIDPYSLNGQDQQSYEFLVIPLDSVYHKSQFKLSILTRGN